MTSDGAALFRAICEQPWEDTPRLIYADWLDENNDPLRAEFIRVQIEAANTNDSAHAKKLQLRAKELQRESRGAWTRGSPRSPGIRLTTELKRGFYHGVQFDTPKLFLERAADVFDWTPIDNAHFGLHSESDTPLKTVLASHYLARLQHFAIVQQSGDAALREIAQCPHLANLQSLSLSGTTITDFGALALAGSDYLSMAVSVTITNSRNLSPRVMKTMKSRFAWFKVQTGSRRY